MNIIAETNKKIKEVEDFVAKMKSRKEIFKNGILHSVEFTMKDGSIIIEPNEVYDYLLELKQERKKQNDI